MITFGSLFAGIGGFDLGLERAGMICKWQVEINDYCSKVLAKHWPDVERYGDIRDVSGDELEAVDLICGGFPCQPYSVAGKRKGAQDDRNLWPEFIRIIQECRPDWIIAENVPGIVRLYLDQVLSDLEGENYSCWTFNIPAVAFDAPHQRKRIIIVAHSERMERKAGSEISRVLRGMYENKKVNDHINRSGKDVANSMRERRCGGNGQGQDAAHVGQPSGGAEYGYWHTEPDVGRVANGIPDRVDRLRALGNAVVPQVAEWIGRRIMEVDSR